ncbi:MAG: hypothetical protein LBE12_14945 [Planctomycetaceae bacterium]|jgi:hypothetical protein|nr:hypothetical protein [Planctomycetaceae bacterium]
MKCSVSHFGLWQFQQIVAWLLLVTFVPIAILCEGIHLLPGMGTCCQSSDHGQTSASHHHHHSAGDLPHQNSHHPNTHHQNSDFIPIDGCVVCEFCSLFNGIGIELVSSLATKVISIVNILEPVLFSGEFFSLFLVRAPPAVIC